MFHKNTDAYSVLYYLLSEHLIFDRQTHTNTHTHKYFRDANIGTDRQSWQILAAAKLQYLDILITQISMVVYGSHLLS
jgi:hypothetical protein